MDERISGAVHGMFVAGFDGYELPAATADLLGRGLAGITLFRRNIRDREQLSRLCRDIRESAGPGPVPIIAVDQEGGRVQRLRDIGPVYPAMRDLQADKGRVRQVCSAMAADLAAIGFNLDFAPVLDVDTNPSNPIIGDRAFSSDAVAVAECAVAAIQAFRGNGIAVCGKHFPGHGDASADSHLELPLINVDAATLQSRELVPFGAAVDSGIGMIMTAHCLYPAVDPELPATLSRLFVRPILRERLGFDGVVITDDLGMKAISDRYSPADIVRLGLDAGIDLFLHCGVNGECSALIEAAFELVESGVIFQEAILSSNVRVRNFRRQISVDNRLQP